ncbi:hypothetical protein GOODEAATRI_029821, partial [Goodea atripinnis]
VTGSQSPTAVAEPARTLWDSYPDDSIKQDASLQVTGSQSPTAVAEPARTLWDSYPDDSIKQDASLQLICLTGLRMAPNYPHKKKIQKLLKRRLVSPHQVAQVRKT